MIGGGLLAESGANIFTLGSIRYLVAANPNYFLNDQFTRGCFFKSVLMVRGG